jgi:hypothetical protein
VDEVGIEEEQEEQGSPLFGESFFCFLRVERHSYVFVEQECLRRMSKSQESRSSTTRSRCLIP